MNYVYKITNKINNKIYVGQKTVGELDGYWGSGKLINRSIEKYGVKNFIMEILEEVDDLKKTQNHLDKVSRTKSMANLMT